MARKPTRPRAMAKPAALGCVMSVDGRRLPSVRDDLGGHRMRHPRLTTCPPALLLLAGVAAPALAGRDEVVRSESKTFNVEDAHRLKIDVSVGEVHVQAGGDRIEVRLE